MDYDAAALTWMLLPPHTVTLTFDLQNLTRSSVVANEYSLTIFINIVQAIHEIVVTKFDKTNKRAGQWDSLKHNVLYTHRQLTVSAKA